jgi:hypothetical protein
MKKTFLLFFTTLLCFFDYAKSQVLPSTCIAGGWYYKFDYYSGVSSCQQCPKNHYCPYLQTKMFPCEQGSFYAYNGASMSSQCVACAAGSNTLNPGTDCMPYEDANTLKSQSGYTQNCQEACPAGSACYVYNDPSYGCYRCGDYGSLARYCPGGLSNYRYCLPGFYSTTGAPQTGIEFCRKCISGMYCPDGKSAINCAPGSSSNVGATSCTLCPAGSSAWGSSCRLCDAGTYTSSAGALTCTACALGSSAPNSGATSCAVCRAGYYAPNSISACLACPAGQYTDVSGSSTCKACPSGTFSAAGLNRSHKLFIYYQMYSNMLQFLSIYVNQIDLSSAKKALLCLHRYLFDYLGVILFDLN